MILTFQKRFVEPILDGTKIHTIRMDKNNRWKIGRNIQFWCGNPRNPSKQPYQFAEGVVEEVYNIKIQSYRNTIIINDGIGITNNNQLDTFSHSDGFKDWEDMKGFFPDYFEGKLIIWEQPIKIKQP